MKRRYVQAAAGTLLAGSLTWAITAAVAPSTSTHSTRLELAGGLAFQIGLGAYLAVIAAAKAAGDRWGQRLVTAEAVVLLLAAVWSIAWVIHPNVHQGFVLAALDAAWPLSMLGLIPVAIAIARARRFPGPSRWAPLLASLWLLADAIATPVGPHAGRVIHFVWLVGPYSWLALALLTQPAPREHSAGRAPSPSRQSDHSGAVASVAP